MATVVGTWAGGAAVPVPPLPHQIALQASTLITLHHGSLYQTLFGFHNAGGRRTNEKRRLEGRRVSRSEVAPEPAPT